MTSQGQSNATGQDCVTPTRFSMQGRLVRLGEQNILFTPLKQAVFTVNDTAADIWRSLDEGLQPESIACSMSRGGVDAADAARYINAALLDWERIGLIRPYPPALPPVPGERVSQVIAVGGVCARIIYPETHLIPSASVFRHLRVREHNVDIELELAVHRERMQLYRNGEWILSCLPDELPTALKGQLLSEVLDRGAYQLALHAAAVLRNERLVLLCGDPGSGKTTLTLALVHAGFGFAADDVTLLDATGFGLGLPFAPAVKAGAWPILARLCPELDASPIFRRPDRRRVRYPIPNSLPQPLKYRAVGLVILLHRKRGLQARLDLVEPADALRGLLSGAYRPGRELSASAFDALTRTVGSAQIYRLTYSRLHDAINLIKTVCR